jgi:hypothetical protein
MLAGVSFGGVAYAEYPPVQNVTPSVAAPEVSFDRTPGTVPALIRKVETPAPIAGGSVFFKVLVGEPVVPILAKFRPRVKVKLTLRTPDGKTVFLPPVVSNANGRLHLPSLQIFKPGNYSIKVVSPNGTTQTLVLRVRP